jgi:hypothetical protein
MEEKIIDFETAVIARNKGYRYHKNYDTAAYAKEIEDEDYCYPAPTQSLLQKWLRDKHGLHPYIVPQGDGNMWHLVTIRRNQKEIEYKEAWETREFKFNSYEKALEFGLVKCLNLVYEK